ncbi:MAG: archease [Acidiferrobacterales bacterium]|jgi:SHS2 domain-containing protein|nr:archease [Acidiferrobacterales bacterium]
MTQSAAYWEHFDHEADIGVRGVGPTLAQAFEQAALAMSAVITPLENIDTRQAITIECTGDDPEVLLVDWLNALVYEMATRNMLFGRYAVQIESGTLTATAWGEPVDVQKHQPAVEIKGATYTALRVTKTGDGSWIAETVVDV